MNPSNLPLRVVVKPLLAWLCGASMLGLVQASDLCRPPPNLIANAGFEEGVSSAGAHPDGWRFESPYGTSMGTWDNAVAHRGRRSIRIDAIQPDDARWLQSANVPLGRLLYLGGWIKSDHVQRLGQPDSPGATVSVLGRWDQPAPTLGTTPWHSVGVSFFSDTSPLLVAPRLGFWGGLASGTAWYDDLVLVPRLAATPHPRWKILVLIYPKTDVTYTDGVGVSRHVVATMPLADQEEAAIQAGRFVEQDIPQLSSGNMLPSVTIRKISRPLKTLTPFFEGWWPAQGDVIDDLDPAFDSVIVIWEARGHDVGTGEAVTISGDGAITQDRGLRQTYTTLRVPYAGIDGSRSTYKQQWAGAISSYFLTMQRVSPPPIALNPGPTQYVNCETGGLYDVGGAPSSPNSIYNNSAGFLHDFYSGKLALAEDPHQCLGIGAQAWAWGGPVTHSGSQPVFSAPDRVDALIAQVEALQGATMLHHGAAQRLLATLQAERRALGTWRSPAARSGLNLFIGQVRHLVDKGALMPHAGDLLIEAAQAADSCAMK